MFWLSSKSCEKPQKGYKYRSDIIGFLFPEIILASGCCRYGRQGRVSSSSIFLGKALGEGWHPPLKYRISEKEQGVGQRLTWEALWSSHGGGNVQAQLEIPVQRSLVLKKVEKHMVQSFQCYSSREGLTGAGLNWHYTERSFVTPQRVVPSEW